MTVLPELVLTLSDTAANQVHLANCRRNSDNILQIIALIFYLHHIDIRGCRGGTNRDE